MTIELDHAIVPSRDRKAAAEMIARIFDVPWSETGIGPFCPVYVNDGLTLDIDQVEGELPVLHYCFRISDPEFDALVDRLRALGIAYRSTPHGPADMQINAAARGPDRVLERSGRARLGSADRQLRATDLARGRAQRLSTGRGPVTRPAGARTRSEATRERAGRCRTPRIRAVRGPTADTRRTVRTRHSAARSAWSGIRSVLSPWRQLRAGGGRHPSAAGGSACRTITRPRRRHRLSARVATIRCCKRTKVARKRRRIDRRGRRARPRPHRSLHLEG